jgi:hypothetical protein
MVTKRVLSSSLGVAALVLAAAAAPLGAAITQVVSCPFTHVGGDSIVAPVRGVYVKGYPGNNLRTVEFNYATFAAGTYEIALTAHRGNYGGPQVGATQTAVVTLTCTGGPPCDTLVFTPVIFDFGGVPVTPGDDLYFVPAKLAGPGNVYFDTGPCPPLPGGASCSACPGVFETNDTTPPFSTTIRKSAGLLIFEDVLSGPCIPSDTVLCIDNTPGDQRFEAKISFSTVQGGGFSGDGQAIPLASLGVSHGGLFWFFGQDNPEMLLKVLNACAVNGKFWVFFSAGTNVGFTLTVTDTVSHNRRFYVNPDLNPAPPVQDGNAFPCP